MKKLQQVCIFFVMALGVIYSLPVYATDGCKLRVVSNTKMQYDTKAITIPKKCVKFSITLFYDGKLKKAIMGHNLVISETSLMDSVVSRGIENGVKGDYLSKDRKDIVASTKLLSGGEEDTLTLDPKTLDPAKKYSFFCTSPGHSAMMHGKISLRDN